MLRAPEEVRPYFRLNEHNGLWIDDREGACDEFPSVNRVINLADMSRQSAAQFRHARGRGRGHYEFDIGRTWFKCADELRAEVHLADADGMNPNGMAVGQRLLEFGMVARETFAEARAPVSAPPHPPKIIRRRQRETDRE